MELSILYLNCTKKTMKLEVGKIYYDIEKEKIFAYTEKEITCPKGKSSNNYSTSKKRIHAKNPSNKYFWN